MPEQGRIGNYWCYDLGEMQLREVLQKISKRLIGKVAINTSFDSGQFFRSGVPLPPGWSHVGSFAVSPPIRDADLESWPTSHDNCFDEWYFLAKHPDKFDAAPFCNFVGMKITEWKELAFDGGVDLEAILKRVNPELVVGNNERTYAISETCLDEEFGIPRV